MKHPTTSDGGLPPPEELAEINQYARSPLKREEVYAFTVTLCDNEIDRDGERFSLEALETLAALYPGKPGLFDHSMKGRDQTARTYRTWVETDETKRTSMGEPYTALRARAYMVRTPENKGLIAEIDAGIKKEVSVGCAVAQRTCSICGANRRTEPCMHLPGHIYDGKRCHTVLSGAQDAYEWSFVAVPAQPRAGVTKAYSIEKGGNQDMDELLDTLKSADAGVTLTKAQTDGILSHIQALETLADDGKQYRDALTQEVVRLCALHLPQLDLGQCPELLQKCSTQELTALKSMLSTAAQADPPAVQLTVPDKEAFKQENLAFQI